MKKTSQSNSKFVDILPSGGTYTSLSVVLNYAKLSMSMSTSYDVQVAAENEVGKGAFSLDLTFMTPTTPGQMDPVTIDSTKITPTYILITWVVPSSTVSACTPSGYILEYATNQWGSYSALTTSTYNSLSYN